MVFVAIDEFGDKEAWGAIFKSPGSAMINLVSYLTTWTVILVALGKWTHQYINLHFLTLFVFMMSSYIAYIEPGYFKFEIAGQIYHLQGLAAHFAHFLWHFIPLVFVWSIGWHIPQINSLQTLNAILIVMIYIIVFDVRKVYDVRGNGVIACALVFAGVVAWIWSRWL